MYTTLITASELSACLDDPKVVVDAPAAQGSEQSDPFWQWMASAKPAVGADF